ncbi:asparaginase [Sulfurimonas lithotrophica]|uniref:Asparaginase n=1 Tax=Sulfurimonas lithotrophica TaxID=2590022 RepID=A0A5P8NYX8_9BACT|nr:asparaginase domain-containing protein [Sulfurimonas lithotrophica]QFR48642.1 asparaginase [Sulfurimonas lithotrophica]
MLILNTGGTFNKRYNSLNGELEVPYDSNCIEEILSSVEANYDMAGVIFKDSLDMDINDRKMLASIIMESKDDKFLIVHGTDTIDETAHFLSEIFDDRLIVLTGAMKPFEIDKVEASLNLGMSIGFLKAKNEFGVYICMNGYIENWDKLNKNKKLGKFELV